MPVSGHQESTTAGSDRRLLHLVIFLFFAWGFATVLLDTLIPKLKSLFALSYAEVMLTQFSFFLSYFLFSLPAAAILSRIGYIRSIVLGLVVMALGSLLISPAALAGVFWGFLAALFVMAAGITMLQVAANPFIAVLGAEKDSPARLTLAQAFNSFGTTVGPLIGAAFILRHGVQPSDAQGLSEPALAALRIQEAHSLQLPFIGITIALMVVAAIFWHWRLHDAGSAGATTDLRAGRRVLLHPRLAFGAACIFLYVGAEVFIGSIMVMYLMQPSILAVSAAKAGSLVSLYWGGAMVGRFIGSQVLKRIDPGLVLAGCALGAGCLATFACLMTGPVAAVAIIAVGLCNSIMFPTIFSLALEGLGDDKPTGSGILCMAIVGGALIPPLAGFVADGHGLATALLIPVACYVTITLYGLFTRNDAGAIEKVAG